MLKLRRFLSCTLALLLAVSMPLAALAEEYDLAIGDISINAKEDGQYVTQDNGVQDHKEETETVITQSNSETPTDNTITITAEQNATAEVTIQDVNIDIGSTKEAAIQTSGDGNVTIELDGSNTVQGGKEHAGVEKNNGGNLTITNTDEVTESDPGSLKATGGDYGAGIGGGLDEDGSNITITGNAQVEATGGTCGAGIGGGNNGKGSSITITGNAQVEAAGVDRGAGIGGGNVGDGSDITISGNAQVEAQGGNNSAGIGGGMSGDGSYITITDNAQVEAQGGYDGAGIGGGYGYDGSNITIDGSAQVEAKGGDYGAGIGGGQHGNGSNITIDGSAQVEAKGGDYGAGIGGGNVGDGSDITIDGSAEVTAQGGLGASGIGGGSGYWGNGSGITVSQDAQVKAQGGSADADQGINHAGTAIGSYGGSRPAEDVDVTTGALKEGWIAKYEPGSNLDTDAPKSLTYHNGTEVTTGENVSLVPEQAPTCTQDGTTAGFRCGDDLVGVTKADALGHSFTNYVSNNDATYESDGTKTAKCDRCDETHTLPDPGSKLTKPVAAVEFNGIDETAFWKNVVEQIQSANPGDTIEVNAGGICTIPYWVIDAAVERGVTLSIHWQCGEDFIIDRQPDQQFWVYSFTTLPQMLAK